MLLHFYTQERLRQLYQPPQPTFPTRATPLPSATVPERKKRTNPYSGEFSGNDTNDASVINLGDLDESSIRFAEALMSTQIPYSSNALGLGGT